MPDSNYQHATESDEPDNDFMQTHIFESTIEDTALTNFLRTHSENEITEKPPHPPQSIRDKNWAIRSDQNFQATIYEKEGYCLNMMGGKIP